MKNLFSCTVRKVGYFYPKTLGSLVVHPKSEFGSYYPIITKVTKANTQISRQFFNPKFQRNLVHYPLNKIVFFLNCLNVHRENVKVVGSKTQNIYYGLCSHLQYLTFLNQGFGFCEYYPSNVVLGS